jgi:glycosyltransferase involved in cell wall biosynthesis
VSVEKIDAADIGIIVPITKMHGRFARLESWLPAAIKHDFNVFLIHDKQDELTGPELTSLAAKINSKNITIDEGRFGSPGAARNRGLELAKNQWVVFWDSDDIGDAFALNQMIEEIPSKYLNSTNLIVGNFAVWNEETDEEIYQSRQSMNTDSNIDSLVLNTGLWRCVFDRESLTQNFPNWKMAEDQYFFLANFERERTLFRPQIIYKYFTNVDAQLTQNKTAINDLYKSLVSLEALLKVSDYQELIKRYRVRQSISLMLHGTMKWKFKGFKVLLECIFNSSILSFRGIYSATLNRNFRSPKKYKKYTNLVLLGGLGNQLFQIAAALSQSNSGKIRLHQSLGNPRVNQQNLPDALDFDFPFEIECVSSEIDQSILKKVLNFALRIGNSHRRLAREEFLQNIVSGIVNCFASIHFREWTKVIRGRDVGFTKLKIDSGGDFYLGYFQSYRYLAENPFAAEQFSKIRLKQDSQEELFWVKKIEIDQPIVVHIRLGDYLTERNFGLIGEEYYRSALKILNAEGANQNIWIFSDDVQMAKERFGEIFPKSTFWFNDHNLTPAQTLEIMRHGKKFVIANSTFSWWAAYLSYDSSVSVIAPGKWFKSLPTPKAIIPESWIQIDPDFFALSDE